MALSLCRTTVDDSARELMEHGTAAFPIACGTGTRNWRYWSSARA